jgi:uncharacterized protein YndB with AHSA1/START domain
MKVASNKRFQPTGLALRARPAAEAQRYAPVCAGQPAVKHDGSLEDTMTLSSMPSAKAELLIRRPVSEVFEAFVDPAITSKFWFTKSSGRLQPSAQVRWDWEMYDFSVEVSVKAVEQNRRILIEWSAYGALTTVEWIFVPRPDNTTFVSITNTGFSGDLDNVV